MNKKDEVKECPKCKKNNFKADDRATKIRNEPVYTCNDCGCIFTTPPSKDERLAQKKLFEF